MLMSVVLLALGVACSSGESKLQKAVTQMNELCPQKVLNVGEVSQFVIDDNNFTIVCEVSNKDITYDNMKKAVDQSIREQLKLTIANLSRGKLLDLLREGNTGICYRYSWPDGEKLDIVYPFDEVETLASGVE